MMHNILKYIKIIFAAGFILCFFSAQAYAQDDSNAPALLSTTSGVTGTSALTLAGVILTVDQVTPKDKQRAALAIYLQHYAPAVRQDIALGHGPTLTDIAYILQKQNNYENYDGRVLRTHRQVLFAILEQDEIKIADADMFATIFESARK